MEPITNFHSKTCWEFLKLSKYSPVAPLYFIVGELPLEVLVSIWQCQAVSGSIWQYLAVSDSIWQYLAISGSIWQYSCQCC